MDTPPPRWVRRLFITPLVFAAGLILTLSAPLLHVFAAVLDLIFDRKRFRLSRFVGIGLAFCATEVFGLFTLFTVWVGSGFGRWMDRPFWVRANMVLTGQYMELITRALRFFLGFRFSYTFEPFPRDRPVILLSRHAGPGDAFLIMRVILRDGKRRPMFIGAAKLQWDPFLDIAGERLGFHYLLRSSTDPQADLRSIRALAESLGGNDTLGIFPEGGNVTPGRRQHRIDSLGAKGRDDLVRVAESLRHTMLPRSGGVVAAMDGAPEAVVLVLAHAGLDDLCGFGDLWNAVPLGREVVAHSWTVLPEDRPSDSQAVAAWLCREWQKVDDWIGEQLAL